jgi:hypothetical protein
MNPMNPSKRKRLVVVAGFIVIVVILVVAVWLREREPEYQGKKLSTYMRDNGPGPGAYAISVFADDPTPRIVAWPNAKGDEAVQRLGTNVIPSFVKWARYEKPKWKTKAALSYKRWPRMLQSTSAQRCLEYSEMDRLAAGMVAGFMSLGPDGTAAVPSLVETLQHTRDHETAERLILCLAVIGPGAREGLPVLREWAQKDNGRHRISAALAIRAIESGVSVKRHMQQY